MANFRKVGETPKVETSKVETVAAKKRGRPPGAPNKKGVAQAKPKDCPFQGTYGRVNGVTGVELLDGMKYRIFSSGNIGTVNVRLRLNFANGESQIIGPASMTFLEDRDDAWRKANGKTNWRSALHVSELDDWSGSETSNWKLLVENFGERKIKAGEISPVVLEDNDDDDDE